jgi:hypothetical protein
MNSNQSRRSFFRNVALGSGAAFVGGESLSHLSSLDKLLLPSLGGTAPSLLQTTLGDDAFYLLQNSLRGGAGLARWQTALASTAGQKPWSVVTIKVVNHVYTQLLFALGEIDANGKVVSKSKPNQVADNCETAGQHLMNMGSENISEIPRFKNLRMKKWFADILNTGVADTPSLDSQHTKDHIVNGFPTEVAFQAALHMGQELQSNNHSLVNFKLRGDLGDLAEYVNTNEIIQSPLGVTCFMMGQNYDKAEGNSSVNIVCRKSPDGNPKTEAALASGRTVSDYVQSIQQSLQGGYSDNNPSLQDNLKAKFDRLVVKEPKIRAALLESAAQFKKDLQKLEAAAALEKEMQDLNKLTGTGQSSGEFQSGQKKSDAQAKASKEFLAQVLYTCHSLRMTERPCRNFQLFLNTSDNDGTSLDIGYAGLVVTEDPDLTKPRKGIKALSNIEGMRQLAVGLNMLAKVIRDHKDVVVLVVSEGGRNINLGDDRQSFGLVLGPKGNGMLDDALYGNMAEIQDSNSMACKDPGNLIQGNVARWDAQTLANHYMNEAGMPAAPGPTTVGDFQMGLVQFLEDVTGKGKTRNGNGNWVKLKRG